MTEPTAPQPAPESNPSSSPPAPEFSETVQKGVREYHEHVRHIFGLFITWFTFFITVNYVGIGWFASADKTTGKAPPPVWLIASLFIAQCVLGIAVCGMLLWYFPNADKHTKSLQSKDESMDKLLEGKTSMPLFVHRFSVYGGATAILTVLVAWVILWWKPNWLPPL
jgi:hypothetical protein